MPNEDDLFKLLREKFSASRQEFDKWWTGEILDFFGDWITLKRIIDTVIDQGGIFAGDLEWVNEVGRSVYSELVPAKTKAISILHPAEAKKRLIKLEDISPKTLRPRSKIEPINRLYRELYLELVDLLLRKFELRRCAAPDCDRVFIARGKKKRYCSELCRNRMAQRARRRRLRQKIGDLDQKRVLKQAKR